MNLFTKRTAPGTLCAAVLLSAASTAAYGALECDNGVPARTFHVSADPTASDLLPIPNVATGGAGTLSMLIAQQATADGYQTVEISDGELKTTGIEAELISADVDRGTFSFEACTESGFLLLAVYTDEEGAVAGAPSDVLGIAHDVNYANVTARSNARIGLEFNRGGADRALSIIEANLPDLPDAANVPFERLVAELVLTENIANVFNFSESQAPVFDFDPTRCVVQDHVVVHFQDGQCVGQLNPAVTALSTISSSGETPATISNGSFTSLPNRLYRATIAQADEARYVIFTSYFDETTAAPLSNDPEAPTTQGFVLGENVITGQVDSPRNTRDFVTFTVPEDAELTGIFLEAWSAGEDIGFAHIDLGSTTVIPSEDTINDFLGGAHISTTLFSPTDNLLEALAQAPQGGTGFEAPLSAGDYTFNIQQTGNVPSAYQVMFLIEEAEPEDTEPAPAATFSVGNSGASSYLIDGQPNPNLTLKRGKTYVFDLNVTGHPFWIKTSPTTGTGNAFTEGVSGNGSTTGQLTFTVPMTAPDTLHYICQFHGAMQGQLNIIDGDDDPGGY